MVGELNGTTPKERLINSCIWITVGAISLADTQCPKLVGSTMIINGLCNLGARRAQQDNHRQVEFAHVLAQELRTLDLLQDTAPVLNR